MMNKIDTIIEYWHNNSQDSPDNDDRQNRHLGIHRQIGQDRHNHRQGRHNHRQERHICRPNRQIIARIDTIKWKIDKLINKTMLTINRGL